MTTTTNRESIELTYIGRRLTTTGKLCPFFLWPNGNRHGLAKTKPGSIVGGIFTIDVDDDDSGTYYPGTLEWTGRRAEVDDDLVQGWVAEDRAAAAEKQMKTAAANAAKDSADEFGDITLRQLKVMMAGRFGTARAALLAAVVDYIR